ncbi:fibronectin type III domain-containing protein [Cryptosporangium sp. NPDC051539]|uniref:fibronectin type III domain-containing protein n=1 Tax=Cryptosporangium sp. NPDC051539 TaxID=3363962 RepID=UPI003799E047
MFTRRSGAVLVVLAVLAGVLSVASPARANPYWRVAVNVTPGRASCTLSWIRDYWDGPVNAYTIWVVPQDVRINAPQAYRKIPLTPQTAGASKSVKVDGLTKGAPYVFWLEAFYPSYFRNGPISKQVATTRVCVPT